MREKNQRPTYSLLWPVVRTLRNIFRTFLSPFEHTHAKIQVPYIISWPKPKEPVLMYWVMWLFSKRNSGLRVVTLRMVSVECTNLLLNYKTQPLKLIGVRHVRVSWWTVNSRMVVRHSRVGCRQSLSLMKPTCRRSNRESYILRTATKTLRITTARNQLQTARYRISMR